MEYIISFLEGIITFISPCMLPMLPVYLSYFTYDDGNQNENKALINSLGFVSGFSLVFILMGALAGSLGMFIKAHTTAVNIICGTGIIFFGLSMLDIIHISIFKGIRTFNSKDKMNFFSALLFGTIFSVSWTPCVGAFLGSALLLASSTGSVAKGILLLLCYSFGLGIPFIISAVLLKKVSLTFGFIKAHYSIINKTCGIFLILIGILTATGIISRGLTILSL